MSALSSVREPNDQAVGPGRRSGSDELPQLVRDAAAGDQSSWDALVGEFAGLVSTVARSFRLNDADVADVAQSTWMRLFEHLDDLNDPSRLGAWLVTTARRECLAVMRQRRRLVFGEAPAAEPEATDSPPADRLLRGERDRALWRSFARLRTRDQVLLQLLLFEPRPGYDEIAGVLDMPIGSIGPTRARALARLRNQLESQGALTLLTT